MTDQLAQEVMDAYNEVQLAKHKYDQLVEKVTATLGGPEEGTRKLEGEEYVITHSQRSRSTYVDKDEFNRLAEQAVACGVFTKTYKEDRRRVEKAIATGQIKDQEVLQFLHKGRVLKLNKPTLTVSKKK